MVPTSSGEKFAHVHQVLTADLPTNGPDGAIAYCATRCQTQELAEFLQSKGMEAAYVHAGLPPETRKNVHQSFIRGDLRAIVATNALAWVSASRTCGWWSTPIYAVPWRITCRRRDALDRTRRLPVAVCSTHWTHVERQFSMSTRSRLTRSCACRRHGLLGTLHPFLQEYAAPPTRQLPPWHKPRLWPFLCPGRIR